MSTQKFLTQSEKEKLQEQLQNLTNLKTKIASASLEKELTIREANQKFERALFENNKQSSDASAVLNNLIQEFNKTYGDCQYMSETGEIIQNKAVDEVVD